MSIIRFVSIKLIFSGFEIFFFLSKINYPTVVTAFMTEMNLGKALKRQKQKTLLRYVMHAKRKIKD